MNKYIYMKICWSAKRVIRHMDDSMNMIPDTMVNVNVIQGERRVSCGTKGSCWVCGLVHM